MVAHENVAGVAIIAFGMVLTPGPNMIYLTSRAISQGRLAGMISLAGVALGFVCYLLASGLGLAALFQSAPTPFYVIRIAGALYLGYLAWGMIKPNGKSPFEVRKLSPHSTSRLFLMGLITNLLNPKIVLMYAALIPQFVDPTNGSIFFQFVQLGLIQIVISISVNGLVVLTASTVSNFLTNHPYAMRIQCWISGTLLGIFAVDLLFHNPLN